MHWYTVCIACVYWSFASKLNQQEAKLWTSQLPWPSQEPEEMNLVKMMVMLMMVGRRWKMGMMVIMQHYEDDAEKKEKEDDANKEDEPHMSLGYGGGWGWGCLWRECLHQVPLAVRHGLSRGHSLTSKIWNIWIKKSGAPQALTSWASWVFDVRSYRTKKAIDGPSGFTLQFLDLKTHLLYDGLLVKLF